MEKCLRDGYNRPVRPLPTIYVWLALLLAGCERAPTVETITEADAARDDAVTRALEFYGTRAKFERPVTVAGKVPGLGDTRSETCGACHQEIYREWQLSTHAHAWTDDAQFMEELKKSRGKKPGDGDVGWLCVNCHTPAAEQLEQLVVGLDGGDIAMPRYVDNPTFDPKMQDDAIGCATCHVENGVVYGPWGTTNAPHPVAKRDSLSDEGVCVRCHQAEQFYESRNLGCFFDTGKTFAASPAAKAGKTCQSCHMPEVVRPLMPGFEPRKTRRHWFGGSLIPKRPEYAAELAALEKHYPDGVSITVAPWSAALETRWKSQPKLSAPDEKHRKSLEKKCVGECVPVAIVVTNTEAGHTVPTGDPERHVDVTASAMLDGKLVARDFTRIGSRYEWWPKTKRLADTRLLPGESRVVRIEAPLGATLEVKGEKFRMYSDAFAFHDLEGQSVRGVVFSTVSASVSEVVNETSEPPR